MYQDDVLNYTIGIQEYLYNRGFENIYCTKMFRYHGEVLHENAMTRFPIQSNIEYEVYVLKNIITLGVKPLFVNIFAANEPNFSHTCNILEYKKEADHLEVPDRFFIAITSDYQNYSLNERLQTTSDTDQVFFFFQGYLAYQWYRQYKLFKPIHTFTHKFNSMSRIIDQMRVYRLYLTSKFAQYSLLEQGQVSCSDKCPSSEDTVQDILKDDNCFLSIPQRIHVDEHLTHKLPIRFDKLDHEVIPNTSYEIDWLTMADSFLHVINETVFYEDFVHLTEKTFKPIVCQRPFIITSTPGSLAFLKRYGFQTFDKWIDESYDSETDNQIRLNMIADEVRKICELSLDDLHAMYEEMRPVLKHNYDLFFGSFEQDVLDEFVENYSEVYQSKF